jgi:tetratricopeptide (TPR) repeat protein
MFVLIMVLGVRMVRPAGPAAPSGAVTAPAAAAGTPPDISQLTPIEAADRLFDRVMTAISAGDSAQAQAFMPMALAAYDRARPLNHDGLFHLSMLNRTANNLDAALDDALQVLDEDPNHLLALAAAAEAAIELGYDDEAEEHYRRILEIHDEESTRPLPEYDAHRRIVDALKQDAERYLAGR